MNKIEITFNRKKSRLTIFKDNKPVLGYAGPIAHRIYNRLIQNQTNINGNI